MPTTPNMNLILPTPTVTPGPEYATENNTAFFTVDAHDHSPGLGVAITQNSIVLSGDLPFYANNATLLRSTRYVDQPSPLSLPADLTSIYSSGGNLYWNNQIGQQVQITAGAALNAASIGGIGGDYTTSTASVYYQSISSTFFFTSAPNISALIDSGSVIIHIDSVASSNSIKLKTPATLASSYTLSLFNGLPASPKIATLDATGQLAAVYDVDNATIKITGNNLFVPFDNVTLGLDAGFVEVLDQSIIQEKLAPKTTGTTVGTGGVAVSATCGAFSSVSLTPVDVTNLSVTITTTGRPVRVQVQHDGNNGVVASYFTAQIIGGTTALAAFYLVNGSTVIAEQTVAFVSAIGSYLIQNPTSSLSCLDMSVNGVPGTYTYKVQALTAAPGGGSPAAAVGYSVLTAYEI